MTLLKILRIIIGIIFLIFLVIIQTSFINSLPTPWSNISLIFILLFFIVLLVSYQLGFWSAIIAGLFLEVFSPFVFGGIFFPLLLTVMVVNFLFNLLFTNRSLSSLLLLSFLGLIIFNSLNFFYLAAVWRLNLSSLEIVFDNYYLGSIAWQMLFVLLGLTLAFIPLRLFSRRFKSVFLVEGRR